MTLSRRGMLVLPVSAMLAAALSACSGGGALLDDNPTPASSPASPPSAVAGGDYRLGAGDKVRVIVFGEQDLSGEFVVGDSGNIDMPLIGSVSAKGATVTEFQNKVVTQLKNGYLNDPKVSIEVLNYRPFFITGEVKNGGEYPFKANLTVQDAVGVAGGYTYRAETSYALIRRAGEDREIKVALTSRVPINPGDSIRIPERFF